MRRCSGCWALQHARWSARLWKASGDLSISGGSKVYSALECSWGYVIGLRYKYTQSRRCDFDDCTQIINIFNSNSSSASDIQFTHDNLYQINCDRI